MSSPRSKGRTTPPPKSPLPGIISALVVVVILVLLGVLLFNRANEQTAAVPTPLPDTPLAPESDDQFELETISEPELPAEPAIGSLPTATSYNFPGPPPMSIDPEREYIATIITPRGAIIVELLPEIAPQTVNNFVFLANNNFYNGLTWHRVLPNFMAQGGDPLGDGTGGPGYSIPAEFTDEILFDQPGLVAMARSTDPDSAGSQFFITTDVTPWLNDETGMRTNYTIFGRVIEGQAIVDGIPLRDPMNPADAARPGEMILGITIDEQ
ncbi:peptidylprolyl isomerase [Candidatus Viridilinea mediisalina]|uniref:Peptidyl-prolyl cis-trans isomerase n=1 Tax=Candidatus Viridilinea mediisalina TaxID=2024553 RepID=A0A2A6RMX0_9CHLR|nr:peptidylprolyl isomerase [Candidatus Viridilinea mediisalina]PDW04251.1 peptidylprolyl isomerase [Candidatus Viridilinea mediisalina]